MKTELSFYMKAKEAMLLAGMLLLLWSCGQGGSDSVEVWQKERDNIEEVELVSIADSLPDMHSTASPRILLGDTIIYIDPESTDRLYATFNPTTGQFLGWFGKFGNGPGEIANFGVEFLDPKNRIMYGKNYNQWNYMGFELDKAVGNPDYNAFVKVANPTDGSKYPSYSMDYLNDTTVFVSAMIPNKDWTDFTFHLGRLDLTTGLTTLLDHPAVEAGAHYTTKLAANAEFIVAFGRDVDRIILFDTEGNIKKSIYGPEYDPEIRKRKSFYKSPIITEDRIYVSYRKDGDRWKKRKEILELDLDGNYIRTLKSPISIGSLIYHKGTNRLYFSSMEEPQFGYIQL